MTEVVDSQIGFSTWFKAILLNHQSMVRRIKDIINRLKVLAQATGLNHVVPTLHIISISTLSMVYLKYKNYIKCDILNGYK